MIASALAALLSHCDEDSFVLFEHPTSGKFVQFAGSATEPLLLDLPAQVLSEAEFDRAVAFFHRLGVQGDQHDLLAEPGGSVAG